MLLLLVAVGAHSLGACAASTDSAVPGTPAGGEGTTPLPTRRAAVPTCALAPVLVPTPPATVPRYAQLDETTDLHVTGVVPEVADLTTWRLVVDGTVSTPLALTYDELRCLDRMEARPLLVCPGFFEDIATWTGVPLRDVLTLAGAPTAGVRVRLYGADGYSQQISIEDAMAPSVYLAYEWEGEPLPIIHGFPLRAVVPGSHGSAWVKWLYRIELF